MFTRGRKKFVALMALCSVLFAALMPTTSVYARALSADQVVALAVICSSAHESVASGPGAPAVPLLPLKGQGHCAFCNMGVPLLLGSRIDVQVRVLDIPPAAQPALRNDTLPCDGVAVHPLSPRAPPRAV